MSPRDFSAEVLVVRLDLMRELRASKARLHVREEIPFYTGPRVDIRELVAALRIATEEAPAPR